MTHAEPLLDEAEPHALPTYPGRYLVSTVALTLGELAQAAQAVVAGLQGHGCEANAARAHADGQVKALRDVWAELQIPGDLAAEMGQQYSHDPGQQAAGDQAIAESGTA